MDVAAADFQVGDDVPHVVYDERLKRDRWVIGGRMLTSVANWAVAGWNEFPPEHPPTVDDADPGAFLAGPRLERMDEYGIYCQALYPNLLAFSHHAFMQIKDPKLQRARIALLTVFSLPSGPVSPALYRADAAIVTAARDADPHVIIMDPLTGHWKFQHAHDGLHPTAAGDAWIARKVASILRAHGVLASPSTVTSAVICDGSVRAKAVLSRGVIA